MNVIKTEMIHKDDIKHGDTVYIDNILTTVHRKYIHKGGFMGTTIYGESQTIYYKRALFMGFDNMGKIRYVPQR